jgi:hypothetical protein
MDRHDVGMVERAGGAGLILETIELLMVEHRSVRQYLESDSTPDGELLGFIDHAHAAATQLAENAEVAELLVLLGDRLAVKKTG